MLRRRGHAWVCGAGHSYDVSRSGYVNLLQPQDRRSAAAGDSKAAIDARVALLEAGVGRALIDAVARLGRLPSTAPPAIVDLGCGTGEALAALTNDHATGIGIDISTAAIEHAARRFPERIWVVANADRRLPLLDGSIDLVISIHGRRNPSEAARVLAAAGRLIVAVPAADDLIELRELVQGERVERDRAGAVIAEHDTHFRLEDRSVVRETHELERDALLNLLRGTYRGARRGAAERVAALERMRVTVASEILVFALK